MQFLPNLNNFVKLFLVTFGCPWPFGQNAKFRNWLLFNFLDWKFGTLHWMLNLNFTEVTGSGMYCAHVLNRKLRAVFLLYYGYMHPTVKVPLCS